MKVIDQLTLDKMLADHELWRQDPSKGCRANFTNMDLRGLDLSNRNFKNAVLEKTNASGCDMRKSTFSILTYCDLSNADLREAKLEFCNLKYTNLDGAKVPPAKFTMEDSMIVYKKVFLDIFKPKPVLELLITFDTKRVSPLSWSGGRAAKALVLRSINSTEQSFMSIYDPRFTYRVGEMVVPGEYSDDRRLIEAPGIHFFLTKQEALAWGP